MVYPGVWKHPCGVIVWFMICWTVSDGFNFPPRFKNVPLPRGQSLAIPEDARPGYVIFTVTASDANGDALTFSVTNPGAPFEFDQKSLRTSKIVITEFYINLTVSARQPGLDYETIKGYNLTLQVLDPGRLIDTAPLTVRILNVNDNYPTLNVLHDTVTVREESPIGTTLNFSVTFSDADVSDNVFVGLQGADASIMAINPSTGVITLNMVIDVDPNNEYKLYKPILFASDGTLTTTTTITLYIRDINDNPPVCNPSTCQGEILEEQTGNRVVCVLTCTDRDSAWSNNNKLTYTIVQGNLALFSVNNSGAVSVMSPLDYEQRKSETVVVRVEDGGFSGHLLTTATVYVTVKPANDIWPVWGTWNPQVPANMVYSINENAPLGTSVLTILATDADLDLGNDITYTMIVTTSGGIPKPDTFSLDPNTGLLSTHELLERDGPAGVSQYTIILQASDGVVNTHVINRTISLVVNDVNDNAPRFLGVPYPTVVLREDEARTGALVTRVSAADDDSISTNFVYSVGAVVSGNSPLSAWRFRTAQPGQLELASDLDLDIDNPPSPVSVLRLLVRDNGVPELTGTATLTVSLIPDNEYGPTIISQPGATPVQVAEDTPSRTRVTRIEGSDRDKGQEGILIYSITAGNTGQAFSIDSNGWISTQTTLDREILSRYILTVVITDSAENNARSVTTSMTIEVTDVDDNIQVCQPNIQTVSILETSPVNFNVADFSCTEPDSEDVLTATVKPPLDSIFGFNSRRNPARNIWAWELKLLRGVDYDSSNQSYQVDIGVSDGKNNVQVKVVVSLTAVNEASPTFQTNPTVTVQESIVRNPVIVYQASDSDYSPHDVVSYKIISVSNGGTSLFNIDTRTGSLLLLSPLDFETLPAGDKTYKIVVVAEDGGGLQGTGTVTVSVEDANDNAPSCAHSLFFLYINETQNGRVPYTILSDIDCNDLEDGKKLTYSLSQTPGNHFALLNGSIQLKTDSLDYETSSTHTLIIAVMDSGSPVLTSTVTVYVSVINQNDGGPVFNRTSPVNIPETADIGQFVVDVVAIDPDGNDPEFGDPQYSILAGDPQNHFFIDVYTGRVSTRKKLDFETVKSYSLIIQAKEKKGPNSATATQVINILDRNDEKPVCTVTSFLQRVLESEPIDYTVIDLACNDADAGTILTYTILSGNTTYFKMDGSKLKLKAKLDYEVPPTSNDVIILVSDSVASHDVNVSGTVITGSVDEGPPIFDKATYIIHVLENQTVYSSIFTLVAKDPDSPSDQNGQVKYSFIIAYPLFSIETLTGQITLTGSLDREREATHVLVARAEDALGSNTATVSIIVNDVNDNPPRFKSSVYRGVLSATDPAGTRVLTVEATDADDPNFNHYGKVTYQLAGSPDFTINSTSGVITNTLRLDTKNGSRSYSLTVTAIDSDGAAGFLSSTSIVNIYVNTSNRYPPVFIPPIYSVTIRENQFKVDDIILSVTAKDEDTGPDGELTLTLVSAESRFYLTQNGNTGEIRLVQNLDYASGDTEYTFEVKATDNGNPAQTGTCTITILVDDTNDQTPLCPRYINLDKVEGETYLTRIVCSDVQSNRNLSYSIVSTTPSSIQPAVSKDGVLTSSTPLDFERAKKYEILLQVRDNGPPVFNTNVTIRLHLIDLNDNDPTFRGPLAFDLPENTTVSSNVLYTVLADSNDGPTDEITYTLEDNDFFYISSNTGEIRLVAAAPDYERVGDYYKLEVCINDTPNPTSRTACSDITVHIIDCNDEQPKFSSQVYQVTVPENADPVLSLVTVTAKDGDTSPRFNTVSYTIQDGNADGCFRVQPSGVVELIKKVDYEKTTSYPLIIQASDGLYNATAQCYINISPVNEHAPVFPVSNITVHVEENVSYGTSVFTASATDDDRGTDGVVRYRIDPGPFVIDSQSGRVSVIGSLDRESIPYYNLTIWAVDQGPVAKTGMLQVTIIVDDVNDHAPTCDTSPYVVSVLESVTQSDTLITLSCVDDDDDPSGLNNALSYSISSVPTDMFAIDQSGRVKLKTGATLDRETEQLYTINVNVTDKSPKLKQMTTVTLSLTVLDVNDNSPYFTSLQNVTVPENTPPGAIIQTIVANDRDEGVNKQLMYRIDDGNAGNYFSLNPTSGELILNRPLDFESEQLHKLLIIVRDRGSPALSVNGTLTVTVSDVNDSPPACTTSIYTATVKENSTNENVVMVSCDDPDVTGLVVYSITNGNDGNFTIDSRTGAVTTRANARLDYEGVQSYVLEITASDGIFSDVTYVKVNIEDVNEYPPKFTPPGPVNLTVPEDADVNFLVYELKASDRDTADLVKIFSIVSGNSAQKFTLDSSTGKLQVLNTLDYESETNYTLTVAVKDSGGLNDTMKIYINVTDVNDNTPTCQNKSVTLTVLEGIRVNKVYTALCSDADKKASPILEYSLPADSHRAFAINNSTGELSIVQPLNYEVDTVILLTIIVREKGIMSPRETTINVRINVDPVNEFDPVFQPTNSYGPYYIPEDTLAGTMVAEVTATDADKGLADGAVNYAIFAGDPQEFFWIDETSGEIRTTRQLNREFFTEYNLTITALDSVPGTDRSRTATANVRLIITDVNNHRPQLIPSLYSLNVSETANYGPSARLAYLIVEDKDEGNNSATTITIISGNSENKFAISGNNLILRDQLDYETTTFYELLLEITDHGQPPLRSSGRVRVKVLPENEAAPYIDKRSANVTIAENSPLGTLVYQASATDSDSEVHGQITFSIDGNSPNEFTINPSTGQLFVNGPLDYDVPPNIYTIIIRATDGAGASDLDTSAVTLRIMLSDVNDNPPKFSSAVISMSVTENVATGTRVGEILATDADSKQNGKVTYSQTGGNGNTYFNVDPTSGIVTTTGVIDYEMSQVFYVSVMAYDGGTLSLTSNCLIKVDVTNINDNDPVISPKNVTIMVSDNTPVGETVMTYAASDLDTGISLFSLWRPNTYFEVDSNDGSVRVKSALRLSVAKIHTLYIQVKDMATQADPTIRTSTATVTINIDSGDHSPVINGNYNKSVPEEILINEIIFKINTTDKDGGQLRNLAYFITDGNIGDAFSVDSQGFVQVAKNLDRETVSNYNLTIQVTDQMTPPGADQTQAYVTVSDVNDNNPNFRQGKYIFTIPEDSPVGFSVGTLNADDADSGTNAELSYVFDSFSEGRMSDFYLHPITGVITVATSNLDNKVAPSYVATVKVKDAGSPQRSSFAQVTININDQNNHNPKFPQATYTATLDEWSDPGTQVLQVIAEDDDVGLNSELSYFIDPKVMDGPNATKYIQVDQTNGNIYTVDKVSFAEYKIFSIVVIAVDKGSPALTGSATVIINIRDINDHSPVFSPKFYNTEVAYDGECNNLIAEVTATDEDIGENGVISYYLQTAAYNYLFDVFAGSGEVKLKSVASPNTGYKLEIQAKDAGQPTRISTKPARVRVDTFIPSNIVVTIRLGISRSTFLAQLDKFLEDLQDVIRTKYPSAVARLWCLVEYDGVAVTPTKQSRRLLADQPVDAHVYALGDNTTDNEENFYKGKDFLPQGELMALFADNPEGDPNSNVQGEEWDYLNITNVRPYQQPAKAWLDETHGKIVTILAIILGLILFGLMICLILRYCCRWFGNPMFRKRKLKHMNSVESKKAWKHISKVQPEVIKVKQKPNNETEMSELKRKNSYSSDISSHKVSLQDMDPLVMMTPNGKGHLPLPRFAVVRLHDKAVENPYDSFPVQSDVRLSSDGSMNPQRKLQTLSSVADSGVSSTGSGPRAMIITLNKSYDSFNSSNGNTFDPLISKLHDYNSKITK